MEETGLVELRKSAYIAKEPAKRPSTINIGLGSYLSLQEAHQLATHNASVALTENSKQSMDASYQFLKSQIEASIPIYGINTNFGDQVRYVDETIKSVNSHEYYTNINQRQENIIRSLSCGLGNTISPAIVKLTMMLRAHCLAQGFSGVNPKLVDAYVAFINADICPVVRHYGSIGASGDLIPLAMIASALIGEYVDVTYQHEIMKAPMAIALSGLKSYKPTLRDGLAAINGTSFMTAIASLSAYSLKRLFSQMLSAVAMTLESLLVIDSAYHPLVHQVKQQEGSVYINEFLTEFWAGSQLLTNLDELRAAETQSKPVQDYYSIRSVPQGFGPFWENLNRAIDWIEKEMNSVNDNPIIDPENQHIHHTANFMGYYVTDACDILKMNIAQASTWIHALLANLVHPRKNHNLPVNLSPNPSKDNGFRSMQLLSAALAVQNRKLAQSHQAFTLPTEGDNQDVNSLGTHAALDFQESVTNLERLVAILLLAATQALEFRDIKKASPNAQKIYQTIRQYSSPIAQDRPMTEEIEQIINLLKEGKI